MANQFFAVAQVTSPILDVSPAVRQLVFLDCRTPDLERLSSALGAGARGYLLDPARGALAQIADVLAQHGAIAAVHIVAHGSPGALHFSSGTLSRASLAAHAAALRRIGTALAPDGDLLLWACEAGRGPAGEEFLAALARATGANVAAATHPVGSQAHGGCWELDAAVGAVTAGVPFSPAAQSHFAGLLTNTPPVLAPNVGAPPSYTENGAGAVLAGTLTVSGIIPNLLSATVRVSDGFFSGDLLGANVAGTNISQSYDAANGILTLAGSDTLAHYQQVLRSVTFASSSHNPIDFGADTSRTFEWQASNGPSSSTTYAGGHPFSVAIGDLNGQGNLDLAVANPPFLLNPGTDHGDVTLRLGTASGTFGPAINFTAGTGPVSVAISDLNGDGNLDIVVANILSGNVTVALGAGGGTFAFNNFAAGNAPSSVAIGDLNGDGKLDLAVADAGGGVSVLLGNGDGTFQPATTFAVNAPNSAAVGDFNGDGKLDIVVANPTGVSILLGNGDGTFGPARNFAAGQLPASLAVADLNGDGKLDVAVANQDSNTVSVLLGNGDGTLGTASNFAVGTTPTSVAIADLNGDGKLDLAVASGDVGNVSNVVSVLVGRGDGSFGAAAAFAAGPGFASVAIADLDGNGGLDLVVANNGAFDPNTLKIGPGSISVLLDAGNISAFQHSSLTIAAVDDRPTVGAGNTILYGRQRAAVTVDSGLTVGDVDNTTLAGATVTISNGRQAGDTLHFTDQNGIAGSYDSNTGALTLTGAATLAQYQTALRSVTFDNSTNANPTNSSANLTRAITWVVNDGAADSTGATTTINIVDPPVLGNVTTAASYLENAGPTLLASTLTVSGNLPDLLSATVHIGGGLFGDALAADVTGTTISKSYDAANQTLTLTGSDTLAHYQQVLRTAAFSSTSDNPTDFGLHPSRTFDWQVNDSTSPSVSLQTRVDEAGGAFTFDYSVAIGDINGDGKNDLVVSRGSVVSNIVNNTAVFSDGSVSVLLGDGAGGFAAATQVAATVGGIGGNGQVPVAIGDLNGDGKNDLVFTNSENDSVLLGNGDGTFRAPVPLATGGQGPSDVAIADLNGDGKNDLAFPNLFGQNVSVLLGNGDGTFQAARNFAVGTNPRSIAIADLNGDGRLDLAVANTFDDNVSVLLGNGDGTFGTATNFATGSKPKDVAIGDLNGDGKLDLVVANEGIRDSLGFVSDSVSLLLGNGDGTFQPAVAVATGDATDAHSAVAIADLNGDGKLDLAVTNARANTLWVLLGNGDGSFAAPIIFPTADQRDLKPLQNEVVAIGDLDGTGGLDIAVANGGTHPTLTDPIDPQQLLTFVQGNVSVLLNAGTNTSTLHTTAAITPVNDAPVLSNVGPSVATTEQTAVLLDTDAAVSDVDLDGPPGNYAGASLSVARNGAADAQDSFGFSTAGALFTVSGIAASGNLQLGGLTFATYTHSAGTLTISFTSSGTTATSALADDVLRHITYTNTSDAPPPSVTIAYTFNDGSPAGGQGFGASATAAGTTTVNIAAVNDAPVATLGMDPYTAIEQTTLDLKNTGMSVSDADALGASETVTLSVGEGTLHVDAGTSGAGVVGDHSSSVTITGTLAQIDALLNTDGTSVVSYIDDMDNPSASTTLTLHIDDGGATGTGGAKTGNDTSTINIAALNDPPVATITPAEYDGQPGSSINLKNNGLSVSDADGNAGSETATLSVTSGTLTVVAGTSGATVTNSGTSSVTIDGTIAQINGLLNTNPTSTVSFVDSAGGTKTLTLAINDNGNTGGGAHTAQDTASIVLDQPHAPPVNAPPVNTLPASFDVEANTTAALAGLSVADPDAGGGTMTTTLSVAHGTLSTASAGGAAVSGSGTGTLLLTGTLAAINTTLAASGNLTYHGNRDFFGADTLTMVSNDGGNTGSGGALTDSDTTALHVNTLINGTPGNDSFVALPGNEKIIAGGGVDTITFDFRLVDATVTYSGNLVIIDGPGSHTVLSGFEVFNFTDGTVNNNDADPLVDDLFYYSQHHDVWNAHVDADTHYHTYGWHEGRDPDAFFSTSTYLSDNPDVRAAGVDPLTHFDQSGWKEGRVPSITFDPAAYLAVNTDVKAAHVDPLAHFLANGAGEARQPIAPTELLTANGFDYVYYLQHNLDVAAAHVDPFQHFETIGWKEGRNPNALFDTNGYLAAYADVAAAHTNPLDHYNVSGWHEGRDPSVNFDTTSYLAAYADVAAAHVNPLIHFLDNGIHEGRSGFADGVFDH
jgi:hypothetical protein